jgi:DNA-binding LacI/PurR family transcriptional regulator
MAGVTLQTIADRLKVSRMTVSNAFSRPDQLSSELRLRILAAAEELGYVGPDPTARALARGTTGAIGVLLTDSLEVAFTDEVATGFLAAVVKELAPTGMALTLLTTDGRGDVVSARDVAIDGALVYSCRPASVAREWLMRRQLPLVFVDQDPVPGITSVNVDDRGGAAAAARHLVELGHRRIDVLTAVVDQDASGNRDGDGDGRVGGGEQGPSTPPHPSAQRMLGWLDALEPAGITPTVVDTRDNRPEEARDLIRARLTAEDRPTAVLCFSDVLAFTVMDVAGELGLAVPDHLSVVGFDDSPAAARSTPPLTTVRQDIEAKGRTAAAALVSTITGSRSRTPGSPSAASRRKRVRHTVLPTELVVRQSTAPPPGPAPGAKPAAVTRRRGGGGRTARARRGRIS